jgi:hypothetical protein
VGRPHQQAQNEVDPEGCGDVTLIPIPQLDHSDQNEFDLLFDQWSQKLNRNRLRSIYYDTKNPLKDLGISIPPQLTQIETALGWPAKGVNALARRCNFDGYVVPEGGADPFGLAQILLENSMDTLIPQGITSSMIHSTAFMATTRGDVQSGEPDVLVTMRSALSGTGIWDARRRGMRSFLSVVDSDANGLPTQFVMYRPGRVLSIIRDGSKSRVFEQRNPMARIPVEPLVYQPELERPFGHARISRTVMSLTDQAIRAMLRAEVSAEFYSSPQRYLLGADESAFQDASGATVSKWKAVMGRFLAIGVEEGEATPTIGQFPQMSMEPHLAHLRQIAQNFAADQNLPISSLGIVQDNPASAEAIYAAKEELVVEAEGANRSYGAALVRSALSAVMLRDNLQQPTSEMYQLKAKFRDPATPSKSSAADAVMKQVQTFPWMSDSDVPLEQIGYDETTIARLAVDRRKGQAASRLSGLVAAAQSVRAAAPAAPAA